MLRTNACAVATASSAVSFPRITSTSCIIGCSAGLKKWRLTKFFALPPPSAKKLPRSPGPIELEFEATSPPGFIPFPSAR